MTHSDRPGGPDASPHNANNVKKKRARSKYTRPCDACSLRKVKCDLETPCSKCKAHDIPCTNNRIRKKCGPQNISRKTRDSIHQLAANKLLSSNEDALHVQAIVEPKFVPSVTLDKLIPCLQLYQTWYYSVWPVVSVAHLTSKLIENTLPATNFAGLACPTEIHLNEANMSSYSLSCAVAASMIVQVAFIKTTETFMTLPKDLNHYVLLKDALRSRESANFKLNPSTDSLLTSFFLYSYYANLQGGASSAIIYLREAISIAQILGLHDNNTYANKSRSETHRLKKIYYLLLVTERFICIEDNVPIILDASIPFPSLDDEEYSTLLCGFTELVKVFAIPDKNFFDKIISLHIHKNNPVLFENTQLQFNNNFSNQTWITAVQLQLSNIHVVLEMPDIQKVNILLSKYWMQSLVWNISKTHSLLLDSSSSNQECLLRTFPVFIARDFLEDIKGFTMFAFELNGPGTCVKLLEIASSLLDSICLSGFKVDFANQTSNMGCKYLKELFEMIRALKNTITLPSSQYGKIEAFLSTNSPSTAFQLTGAGYLSELSEEDTDSRGSDEVVAENKDQIPKETPPHKPFENSPFTEMSLAYYASPSQFDTRSISQLNLMASMPMDNPYVDNINQTITNMFPPT